MRRKAPPILITVDQFVAAGLHYPIVGATKQAMAFCQAFDDAEPRTRLPGEMLATRAFLDLRHNGALTPLMAMIASGQNRQNRAARGAAPVAAETR